MMTMPSVSFWERSSMESIITSINLLDAVLADLDKIPVEGFENQKKFVDCGIAIQTVVETLAVYLQKAEATQGRGSAENILREEEHGG